MSNPNNLALQRQGESETIVIRESKCLIRTMIDNQQVDCCAIFSGPNGTAMRSYVSDVLVNGVPATVRPLETGDEIELPCRTKLTVQSATEIRPVISGRQRSVEQIDEQLASLTGQPQLAKQDPTVISQDPNEEKLLSPFSEDLPQLVADANTAVPETPATDSQIGSLDDIQQHLHSLISETGPAAPQAEANVTNDPSPLGTTAAGVVGGIAASAAAASVASVISGASNDAVSQPAQPAQPTPAPAIPVQTPPTTEAAPQANVAPAHVAAESTANANQSEELPTDLRNQLDDLMASLENQTSNAVASNVPPQSPVPATPEFTTPAPVVSSETPTTPVPLPPAVPAASAPQPEFQSAAVEQPQTTAVPPVVETPASTLPPVFATEATQEVPVEAVEVESVAPAAPPAPAAPRTENRSVAEVLGAMGIALPGQEDPEFSQNVNQPPVEAPAPAPIPEPAQTAPETPVFTDTPQAAGQTAGAQATEVNAESNDANDDIQAYMNRLLNRGSAEGAPVPAPIPEPVVDATGEEQAAPVVPLSAEEFVPNHKPSRPANYESLREIANTSNRAALELSATKASSGSGMLRLFVALSALLAGIVAFFMGLGNIVGVLMTVSVVGFALYGFARKAENKAISEVMQRVSESKNPS